MQNQKKKLILAQETLKSLTSQVARSTKVGCPATMPGNVCDPPAVQ